MKFARTLPSRVRELLLLLQLLCREKKRPLLPPIVLFATSREKIQRTNERTRVLLDFGFHPSFQSVVEGFQKRRAVQLCRGGGRGGG